MKSRMFLSVIAVGALVLTSGGAQDPKEKAKEPEKADITAQVKELNSDKYASPPTKFREGHVKVRKFDAKAITKTDNGFTIQLPSKAPVPTPTVYKGKLFVSGGFHSKEYYCFDAVTGALEWGMELDDDGPTSAVCADDIVVFNTESCTIFALDRKTGKNLWSFFLGDPLTSTPTIANGMVFTSYPANAGGAGIQGPANNIAPPKKDVPKLTIMKGPKLPKEFLPVIPEEPVQAVQKQEVKQKPQGGSYAFVCFELKTGKILWQKWIDADVMSAPVAIDDEVYATTFSGTVYKFKQKDGAIISAHRTRATSAPVIVGNNVYLTQRADVGKDGKVAEEIAGINRTSYAQNFSAAKRDAIYLDTKVQMKSIQAAKGAALDTANSLAPGAGGIAGSANIGQGAVSNLQAFQGSRLLHYANANYNCMGDELVNTDPKDGTIRWKVKLKGDLAKEGGHLAAPPAAAGGQIFLATLQGDVLQVDPKKGETTKTYKVGAPMRSQPAIEGGRIYVGTEDGKVVCINTGDARFTGWYTWGANMAHTNVVEK